MAGSDRPNEMKEEVDFKSTLKDAWELLTRRKRLLLVTAALAFSFAVSDYFFYPSYNISGILFFDTQSSNTGLRALLGSLDMMDRGTPSEDAEDQKYLLALESTEFGRLFSEAVMNDADFQKYQAVFRQPTNAYQHLRKLVNSLFDEEKKEKKFSAPMPIKVGFLKRGILSVTFKNADPDIAIFLGNHYLKSAAKLFSLRESIKIQEAKDYIQAKIEQTIKKMESNDRKIVGVTTKNASVSYLASPSALGEKLLDLREQIQRSEFTFEQNNKVIESLKLKLGAGEAPRLPDTAGDPSTARTPELSILSSMMGIRKTITNLQTENELLGIKINTLKVGLEGLLKSSLNLPKDELTLSGLKRGQGLDFYLFDNLIKTLLQIEVKGLSLLSRVYPLESLNESHVGVTTTLPKEILICLFIVMVVTTGGLYAVDYINPVVRRKSDFDALQISYLGDLPKIPDDYFGGRKFRLCQFNIDSKETIAFKHTRARLTHLSNFSGSERRKVVSFLSYGNSEGKSFVSSNLAACFAHSGTKTLLLDFDLRRGALTKLFQVTQSPGLCDYLRGEKTSIEEITLKNVVPNLDLIPSGQWTTNVTEAFSNAEFLNLIAKLKPQYDFIILDTAPLVVAHESLAIAQDSDFAVLISTAWKTRKEYVVDALEEIKNVRNSRTHILLNHAKEVNNKLISNYYYVSPTKVKKGRTISEPSLST